MAKRLTETVKESILRMLRSRRRTKPYISMREIARRHGCTVTTVIKMDARRRSGAPTRRQEYKKSQEFREYRPTPQVIRAECRRIRAGWSETECRERAAHLQSNLWMCQVIRFASIFEADAAAKATETPSINGYAHY